MNELKQIAKDLDTAHVPKEVWIGTDSTADRVAWLIIRNKLNQQNSHSRFKAMNELAELVEIALQIGTKNLGENWRSRAYEALVLAGKKQRS